MANIQKKIIIMRRMNSLCERVTSIRRGAVIAAIGGEEDD